MARRPRRRVFRGWQHHCRGGQHAFATAIGKHLITGLPIIEHVGLFVSAALLLAPGSGIAVAGVRVMVLDLGGLLVFVAMVNWRKARSV